MAAAEEEEEAAVEAVRVVEAASQAVADQLKVDAAEAAVNRTNEEAIHKAMPGEVPRLPIAAAAAALKVAVVEIGTEAEDLMGHPAVVTGNEVPGALEVETAEDGPKVAEGEVEGKANFII